MIKLGKNNISKLFLGSQAISKAYLGNDLVWQVVKPLPYDAEVEYLESTGTQWIDTGYVLSNTNSVKLQAKITQNPTSLVGLFGSRSSASSKNMSASINSTSPNNRIDADLNNSDYSVYRASMVRSSIIGDIEVFVSSQQRSITLNGETETNNVVNSEVFTTPSSCRLFAASGISSGNPSAFRCLSFRIYNNENLVHDFIPVRVGGVGYMYDRVSKQLFGNQGSGNFIVGPDIVEVEYLESTGTQWIDTGYAFQDNFAWEIDYNGIDKGATLFGGRTTSTRTAVLYQQLADVGINTTLPIAGYNGSQTPFILGDLQSGRHTIKMSVNSNKASVWVDGASIFSGTSFSGSYITGVSQAVFGNNYGSDGGVQELASSKVYGLKMWQGNNLVRDFIPVRVGMEGAMMDRLTRKIYRNQGTGAFKIGADKKETPLMCNSYVKDGLIAMWDGTENAGWGTHDANATEWTALVGGINATKQSGTLSWSDDAAVFDVGTYLKVDSIFGSPQTLTIEVCHNAMPYTESRYGALFSSIEGGGVGIQQNTSASEWWYRIGNPSGGYYTTTPISAQNEKQTLTLAVGTSIDGYKNATLLETVMNATGIRYNYQYYQIGRDTGDPGSIIGQIYSIRLYSRSLTAEEIAWNYEIDRRRFNLP